MKKVLNTTFALVIALVAAAGAQAGSSPTQPSAVDRIIAQEDYKGVRAPTEPTAVDRIVAQEDNKGVRASTEPTAVDRIARAAGPSPAELKALEIRGQALNELCGDSTLTGAAYASLCGTAGAGNRPTPSELNALEIRGQALNHLCDGSSGEISASVCGRLVAQEDYKGVRAPTEPTAVDRIVAQEQGRRADLRIFGPGAAPVQIVQRTAGGFDWAEAGIGGAAALALVLLTAAGLAVRHNRHGARA